MTDQSIDAAEPQLSHREILTIMSGLIVTMLLAMLDNTIVGPALPTIVGDLGGLQHLSWVLTAYTLTTAISTLLWGKLGDLYGRKGAFLWSIVVFLIGSGLSGAAHSMFELTAFRAVQGIGAGGLIVGVMAIIGEIIPPAERGRYQGYFMAIMPIAMLGGPTIGGWITDNASWRWAFYVNLPLGALALVTVWFTLHLPERTRAKKVVIDWAGAGLLTVWVTALVLASSWAGSQYAWASLQIIGLFTLAAVGLAVFIAIERTAAEPILPLKLFANRNFTLAGVISFLVGLAMMGSMAYLPQFQQLVQGQSATASGLLYMPMMLPLFAASIFVGQLTSKTGKIRIFPIIGGVIMSVGMVLLAQVTVTTTELTLTGFMVVLGLGIGFLMQPSSLLAQNSLDRQDMGAGMGANTFLRTMGMTLGTAALGTLYSSRLTDSLENSGTGAAKLISGGAQLPPALIAKLPEDLHEAVREAVAYAVSGVFWAAAAAALAGLVVSFFIQEIDLVGFKRPTGKAPTESDSEPELATA